MMEVRHPLPSFRQDVQITVVSGGKKETVRYNYVEEVPKEIMDAYQQVLGNAQARVSVSTDMADKEFGNGVGSTVIVSLSCNQDQQTLLQAIELAGQMGRWAVKDQLSKSRAEFQQLSAGKAAITGNPNYG